MSLLPRLPHLDPRSEAEARRHPIGNAVNVPLEELDGRMHELPPRHEMISVAGEDPLVRETVAFLSARRRQAIGTSDYIQAEVPTPGRLWEPNQFLQHVLPQLQPGSALDVACGTGRDAVYLASEGWWVIAIDHLQSALELAGALAARYLDQDSTKRLELRQLDVERHPEQLQGKFDLITQFFFLHRELIPILISKLVPGGSIVIETFTQEQRRVRGKPSSDAHLLKPGELKSLLDPLEVLIYQEGLHHGRYTARAWARSGGNV